MDSLHHFDKLISDRLYPDETGLSETYRTLEGFNSPHNGSSPASPEILTASDFNRLTIGTSSSNVKAIATLLGSLFLTLLVSGVVLGLAVNQLSSSIKYLIDEIPLNPTGVAWPPSNQRF